MADQGTGPDEAALAAAARHALHDEELVAAFARGAVEDPAEADRARALIERCSVCRDLHQDIAAIGAALATVSAFTVAAPRDFRLTAADARRLGGPVRRPRGFLVALRRSIDAFARPVGATLATFGLVGVLVGSIGFGGTYSAPQVGDSGQAALQASPEVHAGATEPDQPKSTDRTTALGPGSGNEVTTDGETPRGTFTSPTGHSPFAGLLGGSAVMLGVGLLLLLVAFRRGRQGRTHP